MRKLFAGFCALVFVATGAAAKHLPAANTKQAALEADFNRRLHPQSGDVVIPAAKSTLHLGKDYYFLPPEDAKQVLTQVWGNPPDSVVNVLGMVLPTGKTAFDNIWGAVVTYQDTGYVSDQDAQTEDYEQVLTDARSTEAADNEERRKAGYPAIQLVGWAQPPSYDGVSHALIWARDLKFDGSKVDTLNYDVRLLGRRGVVSLNMVSDMAHLAEVRDAARDFGQRASFDPGSKYADYDSSIDKTAEYGLAGLVAAGVGAVAVKKLGLLAILLGFGKKLIVLVALAGAAVWRYVKRLFGRGDDADATI